MKPVVNGLKQQYEGKVEFRLLNVETDQQAVVLANSLGITAVPTFLFVNSDGVTASTKIGAVSEQEMRGLLDSLK